MSLWVWCVLLGLSLCCQGYYYGMTLDSYNNQPYTDFLLGPFGESFESGLFLQFVATGDLGNQVYSSTDPAYLDKYVYVILDNGNGVVLDYQFLGGDSRINTLISGTNCFIDCVDNTNPNDLAESVTGRGVAGARNYGYLYIDPNVAAQLLSQNFLRVRIGWGAGVNQLVSGSLTNDPDILRAYLTFNPGALVGDPHLITPFGNQESIPTVVFGTDQAYSLYCDTQGNSINGVVSDTRYTHAYILTALEMILQVCNDPQCTSTIGVPVSGWVDATGEPFLQIDNGPYLEVYTQNYDEVYGNFARVMSFDKLNDPKFVGSLPRYYRTVARFRCIYTLSPSIDFLHITVRTGYHPTIKGFFEVIVHPTSPSTILPPLSKSEPRYLNVAKGISGAVGLLFKDSFEPLSNYVIPSVTSSVCGAPTIPACTTSTSSTLTQPSGQFGCSSYVNSISPSWLIVASSNQVITLTFTFFDIEPTFDFVLVYDGTSQADPLIGSFEGNTLPSPLTSSGPNLFVVFAADGSVVGPGFTAVYSTGPAIPACTTSTSSTLTRPSGQFGCSSYVNSISPSWLIVASSFQAITLTFTFFDTEPFQDIVFVYDGTSNSDPLIGSFEGNTLPSPLTSSGPNLFVVFATDGSVVGPGFTAAYSTALIIPACTTSTSSTLTQPSGQFGCSSYVNSISPSWLIVASSNQVITLTFTFFDIEPTFDFVLVYDGTSQADPLIGSFEGNTLPSPLTSSGPNLFVVLSTDGSVVRTGFTAVYSTA
jgi:hypothetical protein